VASGYWRRPDDTEASFHATIAGSGEGPFLRTGDLGFFRADELFVTGRLKHLIIIDGRNHYPQDIEQTVERSHAAIRPGGAAAFTTNGSDRERLVVAVEVDRRFARSALPGGGRSGSESSDGDALVRTIRLAVAEEHDVRVHAVVLLPPGGVPRTGSGKIQRHLCRQAFETHAFETLEA
jgi:acyl-CoA synthetase (AMP-forming)/AMP-acid ligase II